MTESRLLSAADAAAYCGVTPATFVKWVAAGRVPGALPKTRRWDRKAIDAALDKLSDIPPAAEQESAEDDWERKYAARKASQGR
jgi:predicted DNA-binding transcriptional regulator AlpA